MFEFIRRDPSCPELDGRRVWLRAPRWADHREWAGLRESSRNFLTPWEPEWAADEFSLLAWHARLRRYCRHADGGTGFTWFIFLKDGPLAGGISLGNIRRGVALSGQIGYWLGEPHAGQGLMHDALDALVPHAFSSLGLHRLEAACIPNNQRSVRLLEKAGFAREGLMRSYLKIGGAWQDHYLYARINGQEQKNGNWAS